jgi:hypothetical protein
MGTSLALHSREEFRFRTKGSGRIHSAGMGIAIEPSVQGRSESREFPFHTAEAARLPGAEISVETQKE